MADETIYNQITGTSTGTDYIVFNRGGTADFKESKTNWQSGLQTQITTNTNDIATNTAAIATLGNDIVLEKVAKFTSDTSVTIPINSYIEKVIFKRTSGTPLVSIGTLTEAEKFADQRGLTEEYLEAGAYYRSCNVSIPNETGFDIYLYITGGECEATIIYRKNLFDSTDFN